MAAKKSTLRLSATPPGELGVSRHFAAGGILSTPLSDIETAFPVVQSNPNTLMSNQIGEPQQTGGTYQFGLQSPEGRGAQYQFANQTMAEKQAAAGINPNAAYAPGRAGDPKATVAFGVGRAGSVANQFGAESKSPTFPNLINPFQRGGKPLALSIDEGIQRQSRIAAYADKLRGFSNGGELGAAIAANGLTVGTGGKIEGKGTPTSDSVPAQISETGEQIRVSTQERILSKVQDAFLEEIAQASGFDSLNAMLEAGTGQQVGPTIKAGKRAAATGMEPEQDQLPAALNIDSRVAAAIAAPPTLGGGTLARSEPAGGLSAAAAAAYRPELNGVTWNAKGFDPTKQEIAQGTGAYSVTTGANAGKNVVVGPQNYTAADGSPTSDWKQTAQYAQGMAQAQKNRDTLATMQRDRLERDAYSPEITDPRVQINARQQLHDIDAKAAKQGETYARLIDNQIKTTKLASDSQMAGLHSQYLAETDPARREALAERIRGVQGKGSAPTPANLQHVETDRGTMVFDPRTGLMKPAVGTDGEPVGSGKALTEFQGKSTSYGMRAAAASKIIDQVGKNGEVQPSLLKRAADAVPVIGEGLGMAANKLQTPEQQQVEQGQRDFVNAVLRQESGAAISASEFDNARKQYFPQPGDSAQVIAQKKSNRELAINGFRISAGPGAKNIGGAPAPAQAQPASAPKVGMVDGKHVYLGGNPADPASWAEVR